MRGHVLCEMNVPFGRGCGPFHGRHGPFGPHFDRPCAFGDFGGFGSHFGWPGHRRHGHRGCEDSSPERRHQRRRCGSPETHKRRDEHNCKGTERRQHGHTSCEDSSPERRCGRGSRGGRHSSPDCHKGPRHHGHHGGPQRAGHGFQGRHGPCAPPGPPGYGDFYSPGALWCPPAPPGPPGYGPEHHSRHGPNPFAQCLFSPHGPSAPGKRGCKSRCCKDKPRGDNDESSGECRRHCRRGSRGESGSDSSPERHGRRGHRRCRSKQRFNLCGSGRCDNRPRDKENRRRNNECVNREGRPSDAEDHGENNGPGILVQNIVVDNTPRCNSV